MWVGAFAALALAGTSSSLRAEDARVPYVFIYKIQQTQEKLSRTYTNLQVVVRMKSRLPGVEAKDLSVAVETKAGKVPVQLGADGRFTLPMREDWVTENASIVVNQPKGTMLLDWNAGLVGAPPSHTMHYRDLMKSVRDLDPVQEEMVQVFPSAPRLTIAGMKLIFSDAKDSSVVIHAKSGDRTLTPDENRQIIIPLDPALLEENPAVWLPVLPEKADVAFRKNGD